MRFVYVTNDACSINIDYEQTHPSPHPDLCSQSKDQRGKQEEKEVSRDGRGGRKRKRRGYGRKRKRRRGGGKIERKGERIGGRREVKRENEK